MSARDVILSDEDFRSVTVACNALTLALGHLEGVEIKDLDGDPWPEAQKAWQAISAEAHSALLRARYHADVCDPT